MRSAELQRTTRETDVSIALNIDGTGSSDIETGIGFFDHMLESFSRHGLFDITVKTKGDLHVDSHHTVEDTGIVLGQLFAQALGDKAGIRRFASCTLPMDDACIMAVIDISGRGQLHWAVELPDVMLGIFDASLAKEFFIAFASNAGITLHVRSLAGENAHHIIEACFKAVSRALSEACSIDERLGGQLPSTKGLL